MTRADLNSPGIVSQTSRVAAAAIPAATAVTRYLPAGTFSPIGRAKEPSRLYESRKARCSHRAPAASVSPRTTLAGAPNTGAIGSSR